MHLDLIHSCKPALLRFTRALRLHEGQYHLGKEISLLCPAILIPSKYHWVESLLVLCEIFSVVRLPVYLLRQRLMKETIMKEMNPLIGFRMVELVSVTTVEEQRQMLVFELFFNALTDACTFAHQA